MRDCVEVYRCGHECLALIFLNSQIFINVHDSSSRQVQDIIKADYYRQFFSQRILIARAELQFTILQEKIKKPFLTKEQILFGIEKYKKLDLTTQEGKQRLIDGFINAIYVYDDRITFTYNYKDGTETITLSELESAKSSDIKCVGAPKQGHMNAPTSEKPIYRFLFFTLFSFTQPLPPFVGIIGKNQIGKPFVN